MNENISVSTGNETVDKVTKLDISGNVTPAIWRYMIVNEKGRPNHIAIDILADIVYWYKACEERNDNGCFIGYKKKFRDNDYLQRSYEQIVENMNISKNQARDAVVFLEELGVIKRIFRTIDTPNGRINNVMFIALNADVLEKLTYPQGAANNTVVQNEINVLSEPEGNTNITLSEENTVCVEAPQEAPCKFVYPSMEISREVSGNTHTPIGKITEINTYITTENKTDITTTRMDDHFFTSSVKQYAEKVFDGLNLTDDEIKKVLIAADYVVGRCEQAVNLLKKQSMPINNVVGWLIAAIKNDYIVKPYVSNDTANISDGAHKSRNMSCGMFGRYQQRDIDFDELTKKVFAN